VSPFDAGQPTHESHPEVLALFPLWCCCMRVWVKFFFENCCCEGREAVLWITLYKLPNDRWSGLAAGGEGWLQLLSAQEIFPGISVSDFAQRRKALKSYLPTESMVILGSATVKQMTEVVPYPFRQDADYLYFTGCEQPEGLAVLDDQTELCMFMPEHDTEVLQTMWGW
jgi:hypothetical protein